MPFEIDRTLYTRLSGLTTGDRVRLADITLLVVERDETAYGNEVLWGFGGTIRDSMQGVCSPGEVRGREPSGE